MARATGNGSIIAQSLVVKQHTSQGCFFIVYRYPTSIVLLEICWGLALVGKRRLQRHACSKGRIDGFKGLCRCRLVFATRCSQQCTSSDCKKSLGGFNRLHIHKDTKK